MLMQRVNIFIGNLYRLYITINKNVDKRWINKKLVNSFLECAILALITKKINKTFQNV